MEYLSAKLANYILKKGLIDTEAYEIYQYGFQCFLSDHDQVSDRIKMHYFRGVL